MEQAVPYLIISAFSFWIGYLVKQERLADNPTRSIKNFTNLRVNAQKHIKKLKPKVNDELKMVEIERETN